ncbi:MAG TPA: hypothetical protein VD996_15340, partial [Chitinophagaceae bacterium]|nr:hypothetical protein [Chitinophagaceae bacterium]
MALTIIRPGVLDTLQDMGRTGYAVAGINPGGVMDRYAAAVANYLVGNDRNSAVMEMHFPAPQVLFRHDALISVCGADLQPCINEEPIPCWQPVMVRKNGLLHFARRNSGARAYLAVHGGLDCHSWLNSCSTNLKVGAGGYKGRALMKGDVIGLRGQAPNIAIHGPASFRVLPWG